MPTDTIFYYSNGSNSSTNSGILYRTSYSVPQDCQLIGVDVGTNVIGLLFGCFQDCSGLSYINISNGVLYFDVYCFAGCIQLTNIIIPKSVTDLNDGCFAGCTSFTHIDIPTSVTYLGGSSFQGCINLKSVIIPNSVTRIRQNCFYGCTSLESIILPNGVSNLEDYCFFECISIPSIIIPKSVVSLGNYCFRECTNLTTVTYLNPSIISNSNIGNDPFVGSPSISTVNFYKTPLPHPPVPETGVYNSNYYPSTSTFNYYVDSATSFYFSDGSTSTSSDIVLSQTSYTIPIGCQLIGVDIGSTVIDISNNCFQGCAILPSVVFPDGLISLGNDCFAGCLLLHSINIPPNVTYLGNNCFASCTDLTTITYSNPTLINIGSDPFNNTPSISTVDFYETMSAPDPPPPPETGVYIRALYPITSTLNYYSSGTTTFYYSDGTTSTSPDIILSKSSYDQNKSLTGVNIAKSVTDLSNNCFYNSTTLSSIVIENNSELISFGDNCFYGCSGLASINIPTSVIHFGDSCFRACAITSINIPPNVTSLPNYCFAECLYLKTINIPPNSVTSFGNYCFATCVALTSITIPPNVASLPDYCFYNCFALTSIIIPPNVASLGEYCFTNSGLQSIILPSSINILNAFCFSSCRALTTLSYLTPRNITTVSLDAFTNTFTNMLVNFYDTPSAPYPPVVQNGVYNPSLYETTNLKYYKNTTFYYSDNTSSTSSETTLSKSSYINNIPPGSQLERVDIGNIVVALSFECFKDCTGLLYVDIPSSIQQTLTYDIFYNCIHLGTAIIGCSNIGENCFLGFPELTSVTIKYTNASGFVLGPFCFKDCVKLSSFTFELVTV